MEFDYSVDLYDTADRITIEVEKSEQKNISDEVIVDVVEPMGSISYVYVRPVDQSTDDTFVVEIDGQKPVSEGQRLYAHVPNEDVHLFDMETGETIHQRKPNEDVEAALSQRLQDQDASAGAD